MSAVNPAKVKNNVMNDTVNAVDCNARIRREQRALLHELSKCRTLNQAAMLNYRTEVSEEDGCQRHSRRDRWSTEPVAHCSLEVRAGFGNGPRNISVL